MIKTLDTWLDVALVSRWGYLLQLLGRDRHGTFHPPTHVLLDAVVGHAHTWLRLVFIFIGFRIFGRLDYSIKHVAEPIKSIRFPRPPLPEMGVGNGRDLPVFSAVKLETFSLVMGFVSFSFVH